MIRANISMLFIEIPLLAITSETLYLHNVINLVKDKKQLLSFLFYEMKTIAFSFIRKQNFPLVEVSVLFNMLFYVYLNIFLPVVLWFGDNDDSDGQE